MIPANVQRPLKKQYKKNHGDRLRRQTKTIHVGDYVFLRREPKEPKESPHKLAQLADEPYLVKAVATKTVDIEISEKYVEKVSSSGVSLAPSLGSNTKLQDGSSPVTEDELGTDFPTQQESNLNDIPLPKEVEEEKR